jgi:hypothetical protein
VILNLFETGSNIPPAPAWDAGSSPIIVILWLAPYVEHTVNRACAAKNLAAHEGAAPFTAISRRRDWEVPHQSRIAMSSEISSGHMDKPAFILRACLNQED